jgi:hypothetical protein
MTNPDLAPTLEVIEEVALQLEASAARVRAEARRLAQDGDLATSAGNVLKEVVDISSRVRLDLLVTRPIRALMPRDESRHRSGAPTPR